MRQFLFYEVAATATENSAFTDLQNGHVRAAQSASPTFKLPKWAVRASIQRIARLSRNRRGVDVTAMLDTLPTAGNPFTSREYIAGERQLVELVDVLSYIIVRSLATTSPLGAVSIREVLCLFKFINDGRVRKVIWACKATPGLGRWTCPGQRAQQYPRHRGCVCESLPTRHRDNRDSSEPESAPQCATVTLRQFDKFRKLVSLTRDPGPHIRVGPSIVTLVCHPIACARQPCWGTQSPAPAPPRMLRLHQRQRRARRPCDAAASRGSPWRNTPSPLPQRLR